MRKAATMMILSTLNLKRTRAEETKITIQRMRMTRVTTMRKKKL